MGSHITDDITILTQRTVSVRRLNHFNKVAFNLQIKQHNTIASDLITNNFVTLSHCQRHVVYKYVKPHNTDYSKYDK